jgi:hypothetical protein
MEKTMRTNEQDENESSAIPHEWWVAGAFDGTVYLYCSRTGEWGLAVDPSNEEESMASRVNWNSEGISNASRSEASNRWQNCARVRLLEPDPYRKSGPASGLRAILVRMLLLCDTTDQSRPNEEIQAMRQDIACVEDAVLWLEQMEFDRFLEGLHEVYRMTELQ